MAVILNGLFGRYIDVTIPHFRLSLPMKNDSTPLLPPAMKTLNSRHNRPKGMSPRRSTLILLRQFARAYSCAPALPPALGSFVAN